MSPSSHYAVFAYLQAEKSTLYRRVLQVFVGERDRFVISLRRTEICELLRATAGESPSEAEIEQVLIQLKDWGNLDDTPDSADPATIEEFYQRRRLYQLSAAGEAAERALKFFDEHLHRPGELQSTTLKEIADLLDAIMPRLADQPLDDGKLHHLLTSLVSRFEELTTRAQAFMRDLQSAVELHGITLEAFMAYKGRLIDYLEKFIGDLVVATGRISETLVQLEEFGIDQAFRAAARRELADVLDPAPDAADRAYDRWLEKWRGLRKWFVAAESPSQSELLRARARSAIPTLLATVSQINDRRASRADRAADFSTLARWFAQAPTEADCRRLWRIAFALTPARHLRINAETLAERTARNESAQTSWLDGVPLWLSPRLRQTGRSGTRGPANRTIDRAAEKKRLAALAREQATEIEQAWQWLTSAGRWRLGAIAELEERSFQLFLELLGHTLSQRRDQDDRIEVDSSDGTLRVTLEPIDGADVVALRTTTGEFRGRDHWITIKSNL